MRLKAYSDINVTYEDGTSEDVYGVRVYAYANSPSDIELDDFETDEELPKISNWDIIGDIYDINWQLA